MNACTDQFHLQYIYIYINYVLYIEDKCPMANKEEECVTSEPIHTLVHRSPFIPKDTDESGEDKKEGGDRKTS